MDERFWARVRVLSALALLVCVAGSVAAQRRFFYGWDESIKNIPYDGRFTFARIRYTPTPGGYWAGGSPSWVHGYPLAEQNLMRIMDEISLLDAAPRRHERRDPRRSGALPVSRGVHHRGRLVVADA